MSSTADAFSLPLETTSLPLTPEIRLRLIHPSVDLEGEARAELADSSPFWAFCWASGQVLARYLLDHPELVRGKRVVDFASGSGVVAIAAARAGATQVLACDCDPAAREAAHQNAALNGVTLTTIDSLEPALATCDLLLAADVLYDPPAGREFLAAAALVPEALLADPGRHAFPLDLLRRLDPLWQRDAQTLPDIDEKTPGARVYRLRVPVLAG
jgi:predicted nicotinamide N-methyase